MGNGALPNGPSYRAHPRLYLNIVGCRQQYVRNRGRSGSGGSALKTSLMTQVGHLWLAPPTVTSLRQARNWSVEKNTRTKSAVMKTMSPLDTLNVGFPRQETITRRA